METNDLYADLCAIQSELSVPKGRNNDFGGFKYRKAEDILEAVKPMLKARGIAIVLNDEIIMGEKWTFLKATATIQRGASSISTVAYARHADEKKGMDAAQITGSTSSYARKYALAGLFAINDCDDPDDPEKPSREMKPLPMPPPQPQAVPGVPGMKIPGMPGAR